MRISKRSIDDLNVVVSIAIEKQDYEATVNETLKDYRKKANMPGFRKGMVPAGLIKKMYGKSAVADEVNKLISRELTKYIADEQLNILGEPLPSLKEQSKIDFDSSADMEFVFDLGLSPDINVNFNSIGKIPYYQIDIDDQLIDNQIQGYTNRFGENIAADVVGEKETTIGDFVQVDEAGNILQDQILHLEDLSIDGISLNYLNFKLGKFIPDLTKRDWLPPVITGQCSFGHCGEWQMEFAVPTYLWLLENF